MRKFFLISSAAVSLFAVGCSSPQSVCESFVDTACDRAFECQSEQVKDSTSFKTSYGNNVAECKTKLAADFQCAEKKDFDELCSTGKTYDLGKATECLDARNAQSCTDYNDLTKIPAACMQICK